MAVGDLRSVYLDYLACLNERRWEGLDQFVADDPVYNGDRLSRNDYRSMIIGDVDAIPDLRFEAELLLCDGDIVSARLVFRCHPQKTFLGFEPTGGRFTFPEHVFYRFENRRIVEVWSVIDTASIRRQLAKP